MKDFVVVGGAYSKALKCVQCTASPTFELWSTN